MAGKKAIIIGAGPAGLTAAYELLKKTDIQPLVFEMSDQTGGLSRTVNYKGNRIDIGGHRFFSKSSTVLKWWEDILPQQKMPHIYDPAADGRPSPLPEDPHDVDDNPDVMLVRSRVSRIYYLRQLFSYPLKLNFATLRKLGYVRVVKIACSYLYSCCFPIKEEKSLEDFFINRFGRVLYRTFFKDYTEKVWGIACDQIKPEWGAQRIKGLSVLKVLKSALMPRDNSIEQEKTETSLINRFLYPKYGPGQMWETVARRVVEGGGEIHYGHKLVKLDMADGEIRAAHFLDAASGERVEVAGDHFFSSVPVKELIHCLGDAAPPEVQEVARDLVYRDFLTVGLLADKLTLKNDLPDNGELIPDNWLYIQETDVKLGRIQIFNNWSPYMVRDPNTIWLGLEYFCTEGDDFWRLSDGEIVETAVAEMDRISVLDPADVIDSTVIRMPKAYPAYWGSYEEFDKIRAFTDTIANMNLVGRNGMHRYNNQDHSMLTAIVAVDNIAKGITDKSNIWDVNTEQDYHEEQSQGDEKASQPLQRRATA